MNIQKVSVGKLRAAVYNPRKQLKKSVGSLISTIGLVAYFVISFSTGAWFITWLIFPIIGAVKGVVNSCIDLKEDY